VYVMEEVVYVLEEMVYVLEVLVRVLEAVVLVLGPVLFDVVVETVEVSFFATNSRRAFSVNCSWICSPPVAAKGPSRFIGQLNTSGMAKRSVSVTALRTVRSLASHKVL